MFLNVGSVQATIIVIAASAFEKTITRAFVKEFDEYAMQIFGVAKPTEQQLKIRQLIYMYDASATSLVEVTCIFSSTFIFLVLQPHALAFDLGYAMDGSITSPIIFVQLLLELSSESIIAALACRHKTNIGIPVLDF